jgi:LysR family transcriptional regulator, hydrogen peroxide-inducible genes activator
MNLLEPLPCSLRQLQYVVAVADLGGFGRAAARCHVSQPSLSAQIALVEQALGVRLFERDRRVVRLSAAGAAIIDRARQVLLAARDLVDAARGQSDPFSGTVRIGVLPTVCPYLLPDVTVPLHGTYPDLLIQWTEDKTTSLVGRISDGTLDGAIVALDPRVSGFESFEIDHDPFVLAAAPGHPLLKSKRPITPAELDGAEVLLLEDGHCLRDQALAICAKAGATEADYRATSLATLVQMVGTSSGVTLLPALSLAVENRRSHLAIRPFVRPVPGRTLAIVWRRGSALKTTLQGVAKIVRTVLTSGRAGRSRASR